MHIDKLTPYEGEVSKDWAKQREIAIWKARESVLRTKPVSEWPSFGEEVEDIFAEAEVPVATTLPQAPKDQFLLGAAAESSEGTPVAASLPQASPDLTNTNAATTLPQGEGQVRRTPGEQLIFTWRRINRQPSAISKFAWGSRYCTRHSNYAA